MVSKNDFKMPLYSSREFEAGVTYLELRMNLDEAQAHELDHVASGYRKLTVKEANAEIDTAYENFQRAVREETDRMHPDLPSQQKSQIVRRREKDILASLQDTGYTCSHWDGPGR